MESFKKQFSENLRKLRLFRKIKQEQLAEQVGISTKTLSYWENGHNTINFNKLPVVAKALNVPIYRLFVFEDIQDANVINDLINTLDKDSRKIIIEMIKLLILKQNK